MSNLDHIKPQDVMAVVNGVQAGWRDWLARWIKLSLANVPDSVWRANDVRGVNTPALMVLLGLVTLDEDENKKFRAALNRVKAAGLLDGYWTPHPTRKYMSRPILIWHLPGQVPAACRPDAMPPLPEMF